MVTQSDILVDNIKISALNNSNTKVKHMDLLYLRKNSQQFFDPHTTEGKVKVIIKKARRAKKEVGKRSKSKQLDKITINQGNVTSINYL